ncbi:hypothetical protein LWM68_28975 [Niabella sp. W65]|nr:hypothetical protein [Niabella sp. W65]MCH7366449.1 hypothetical protein [Niabella sp. W65]
MKVPSIITLLILSLSLTTCGQNKSRSATTTSQQPTKKETTMDYQKSPTKKSKASY